MYLERIKEIASWDYCKFDECNDEGEIEICYQFGWKDGYHFYLSDYLIPDELGQFFLIYYLDKNCKLGKSYFKIEEIIEKIREIIS